MSSSVAKLSTEYSHAPYGNILVNDEPYIGLWAHKIII